MPLPASRPDSWCGPPEALALIGPGRFGFTKDRTHTAGYEVPVATGWYRDLALQRRAPR